MSFKIGDVCEIIGSIWHQEHIGREVTITDGLATRLVVGGDGLQVEAETYRATAPWLPKPIATSGHWSFRPECLRLKKPPSTDDFLPAETEWFDDLKRALGLKVKV